MEVACRLANGTVGGEAGAHVASGDSRFDASSVDKITRMRNEDVARISPIDGDAEIPRLIAQMLVAARAARTGAAPDPWIGGIECCAIERTGIRPRILDRA